MMFFERLPELVTTNRNGDEIRRVRTKEHCCWHLQRLLARNAHLVTDSAKCYVPLGEAWRYARTSATKSCASVYDCWVQDRRDAHRLQPLCGFCGAWPQVHSGRVRRKQLCHVYESVRGSTCSSLQDPTGVAGPQVGVRQQGTRRQVQGPCNVYVEFEVGSRAGCLAEHIPLDEVCLLHFCIIMCDSMHGCLWF